MISFDHQSARLTGAGGVVRVSTVPWRRPRYELVLLVLVSLTALSPLYIVSQDNPRLCLSDAVVHGRLYNDGCFDLDRSVYRGHEYSDKAPGLSFLELPFAEALRLREPVRADGRLWLVRLFGVGTFFVVGAFLVGRVAEGIAPGYGGITLVSFALGTLVGPFGAANFDEVPAGVLGFAAFLLAWRRNPFAAGGLAGAAVAVEYQAAIVAAAVAAYVALIGLRPLLRYLVGALPAALLLGVYDWLAFGAPWRLSYRYVDNVFTLAQQQGVFGIAAPSRYGVFKVFSGEGGLLVTSPVLVAAAWGLLLLGRRYRAEALLCATVTVAFLIVNVGYFLPYGGSPGPRFVIPALPFLALGLAPAFARFPRTITVLAVVSVVATTAKMLNWFYLGPLWRELARIPTERGSAPYVQNLVRTFYDWVLPGRTWGAALVAVLALTALAVGIRSIPWNTQPSLRDTQSRRRIGVAGALVVVVSACAIAAANAFAAIGYEIHDLSTSVTANVTSVKPGQEVDFQVETSNSSLYTGYANVILTITLTPRMRLLGSPYYERGSGCRGTSTIRCDLGDLSPRSSTPVRFGVTVTAAPGQQTLTATAHSGGYTPAHPATFTVTIT